MKKFNFKNKNNVFVILIFSLIFLVGALSVNDYGVSSDSNDQRHSGFIELNHIGQKILPSITKKLTVGKEYISYDDERYKEKYSGQIINTTAAFIEVILKIKEERNKFLLRQYIYFIIFFLCMIVFYKLCNRRFENWKIALLGVIFLYLSPRIFAYSFSDPKDIPFMSLLVFSVFFGLKFFDNINIKNGIIFGFINGLVISGVRILGLVSPMLIYSSIIFYLIITKQMKLEKIISIIFSIIVTILFTILFKPYLWDEPLENFLNALRYLGEFGEIWQIQNLFLGKIILAENVPWYYSLYWITITTPITYTALFLVGLFAFIKKFIKNTKIKFYEKEFYFDIIFLALICGPLIGSMILKSGSFNSWRHLFFIYPYIIIFTLHGYRCLSKILIEKKIILKTKNLLIFLTIIYLIFWNIKNHPHQYAYFNFIAGKDIHKRFDIDYWGLSYVENLKYILKNDNRERIYIKNNSMNKMLLIVKSLDKKQAKRIIYNFKERNPDYIITNYYMETEKYKKFSDDFLNEKYFIFNEIIVDGNKINTVFKKINN
jgi:hypothetical protein